MTKFDVGQTIQILANVGVIAGIVFLAVQVQQNSAALGVQARLDRLNVRRSISARPVDNPELGRALLKAQSGEALTSFERFTLDEEILFRILNWEIVFNDVRDGLLEEDAIPLAGWKTTFHTWPGMPAIWKRYPTTGGAQNVEFVAFVNKNIVEP